VGFKDLLNKGKCLVGLHQGEWRAAAPTDCTFIRVCTLCHIESRRVEHTWPEWAYAADESCDQVRVCSRCSSSESRVNHSWGEVAYIADDSCDRQQICNRCRATTPGEPLHVLDSWRYTAADTCHQLQTCSRCHFVGSTYRVEHSWTEWQHSNAHNGPVRVCRRCGDMQTQPASPPAPTAQRAAASPTAGGAKPAEMSRKDMFEALKGKMQMLADQNLALDRVLGSMTDSLNERLAEHESKPPDTEARPRPPVFTDDSVGDMLRRAGVDVEEDAAEPQRDARLIGHWQYTDIIPGGGMTTEIHLVLENDGSFRRYSTSWGPAGRTPSPEERGQWHVDAGYLVLHYDDDQESRRAYKFSQGQLLFPGSKWPLPWSRGR
jgi:hypothetical protein